MRQGKKKQYLATVYLRLSKEDGDVCAGNKQESDSISNQRDMIMSFLEKQTDIRVVQTRVDDGYTGVDFERPEFQKMMEDVRKGITNCIVVKDLSRLGRNYIEVGRYLEKIFPRLGVRFIAVNDNYDSNSLSAANDIIIPFKNLMNDSYCRDISTKIRTSLRAKIESGDFIGSFAVYGYLKSDENKNQLIVDSYAAEVVKDIFRMKLNGMSQSGIAACLNEQGILSPMEYKKSLGMNYSTPFKTGSQAKWSPVSVTRILENEIYTGVMIQGKYTTPNHKVHIREKVAEKDWVRVMNTHEPIIDSFYFNIVQKILERDTRISLKDGFVNVLSGLLFCGDCGAPMVRKVVTGRQKRGDEQTTYCYYVCKNSSNTKTCTSHRIRESLLLNTVLLSLKLQINELLDTEKAFFDIDSLGMQQYEVQKYQNRIRKETDDMKRYEALKCNIYEDFRDGLLDKRYFQKLNETYSERVDSLRESISQLEKKVLESQRNSSIPQWIKLFKENRNISELTRATAVTMIDRILVHEGGRIQILYNFGVRIMQTSLQKEDRRNA